MMLQRKLSVNIKLWKHGSTSCCHKIFKRQVYQNTENRWEENISAMIPLGIISCNPYSANSFDESDRLDPQLCRMNICMCTVYEIRKKTQPTKSTHFDSKTIKQDTWVRNYLLLHFSPQSQPLFCLPNHRLFKARTGFLRYVWDVSII